MQSEKELPRIDRYTCCFENPVMETRYREYRWGKHKKYMDTAFILIAVVFLLDLINMIQTRGSWIPMAIHPIYIALVLMFRFANEKLKAKYYQIFFVAVFSTFHLYQLVLAMGDSETAIPPEIMHLEFSMFPMGLILVFVLLPFRFVLTMGLCLFFVLSSIPMLMMMVGEHYEYLILSVGIPFVILALNKWRTEQTSRQDFSKTVSIDDTRKLMHQTLQRYFGEVLSDKILTQDGDLKGETRWVTLTFTDIASYSTILERMSPSVAVEFLNEYFTAMHEVIEEHHGQILNYIGDAVMVIYGAPQDLKNHETHAVKCAIKMRDKLDELNARWEENELSRYWQNHGIEKITARTGLHTGNAITGNIGSDRMLQYSAIGDVVNVAARLEQANKQFGSTIAFSEEIHTALTRDLHSQAEFKGELQLKGREGSTKVYSI